MNRISNRNDRVTLTCALIWDWWKAPVIATAIFVAIVLIFAPKAHAGVNMSFNTKDMNANVSLYKWDGDGKTIPGQYQISANLGSHLYKAQDASVSWVPYWDGSTTVELYLTEVADSRGKPQNTARLGGGLSVNMYGKSYYLSSGTNYYDTNGGGKGAAPIDGSNTLVPAATSDYWSQAYNSLSFDDTGVVNVYGSSNLNASAYNDYWTGNRIDRLGLTSDVYVQFGTVQQAAEFTDVVVAMGAVAVPEPSAMMALAFAPLALLARRPRRVLARA